MPETTEMNGVHLTHFSKLMQNYEAETPVSVEGHIVSVRDPAGQSALFTVGSRGKVYCLRADPASDTGWSQSFTGVTVNTAANDVDARKIAAALDRDKLILFAISSNQSCLVFVKEDGTGWTESREVGGTRVQSPILAVTAQQPATGIVVNFFVSAFPSTNRGADGYGPYTGWSGAWLPGQSMLDNPFQFTTEDFELTAVSTSTNTLGWIGSRSPQIYTRYTTRYSGHVITDHGSGTDYNFEIWRPIPDDGFFIVGDVALQVGSGYPHRPPTDPTLTIASTTWEVAGPPEPDPALTKFTYRQIWNDSDSHADMNSSVFTAEAKGYVNLGHVFKDGESSAPPEKVPLAIVRNDLVTNGKVYNPRQGTHDERNNQNMIYMNINGHGDPAPLSMDRITAGAGALAAGTFYAHRDHKIPVGPAYSLNRDRAVHSAVVEWQLSGDSKNAGAAISQLTSSPIAQLSVTRDAQGNNRFAVLLADGSAMLHDPAAKNWIVADGHFVNIALSTDASGSLEMFAIDKKRRIVHTRLSGKRWGTTVPLDNRVQYARLALTKSADGHTECFATGAGQSVTRIFQDPSTTNWAIEDVALMDVNKVVEIHTYTTEVHLTDLIGAPLRNLSVSLSSDDLVKATVNGAVNLLEDGVFTPFQTDGTGCLTILYSTTSLNAPVFHLKAPGMDVDEHCVIEMNAGVHDTLKNVSPETLMQRFHTSEKNAMNAAMAISSVMSLKVVDKQDPPPHVRLTSPGGGLHYRKSAIAAPLKLSTAGIPQQSFRIEMSKGSVRFTPLPASAAPAGGLAQDITARDPRDLFSWLEDIGDMAAAVAEAIVDTVVYEVSAAAEGVLASVRFVIGELAYEFSQVIDRIEHLFDIVAVVFASINAAFEEIVKWVGFLFSWNDILITKEALSHLVTETLPVLKTAAEFIRTQAAAGIRYARTSLPGIVEGFVRDHIGAGDDLANAKAPDITEARDWTSGTNIFLSGFVARPDSAAMAGRMMRSDLDPAIDDLFNLLKEQNAENGTFGKSTGFANAQRFFEAIPGNPDQFLTLATSALINTLLGIAEAALDLAEAVVDKFCSAVAGVVDWVLEMIQSPIDIPILSKIYADYVIGDGETKLTMLDLCSLICAIPATVAAKLVTGDVQTGILKDRAQLDQFRTLYTSRWLEGKFGLSSSTQRAVPRDADEPHWFRRTLSLLSGMSNFAGQLAFAVIEGILDTVSLDPMAEITEPSPGLGLAAVSLGFILFVTSCPYLMDPKNPGGLGFDPDHVALLTWLTTGIFLPVVDGLFFAYSSVRLPSPKNGLIARNLGYFGAVADYTFTLFAFGGSIVALSIGGVDDALIFALNVVITAAFGSTALRVIRLPPISRAIGPTNPLQAPSIASIVDFLSDWLTAACVIITTRQYFETSSSATA